MRTALTVIEMLITGMDLATEAADTVNGNSAVLGPDDHLLFSFFSAVPCTVTMVTPATVDGDLDVADRSIVLTPGTVKLWILKDSATYRNDDGTVHVDFSAACAVAVYKV